MHEAKINTGCIESIRIGATHEPDSNTFAGIMDEVMIFDTDVSPSVIWQTCNK
jgi:hypothetical protein